MFVYHIYMTSPLCWLLVLSLYKEDYLHMFKVFLDYTALAVNGEVKRPNNGLTTPFWWLLFLELTDLSLSLCHQNFGGVFVLSLCFFLFFFCGLRGFCHRSESGLFLSLLQHVKCQGLARVVSLLHVNSI